MKKSIRERLAESTAIPDQILLDTFRVVMTGGREVTVENFKGIIEYSPTLIRLRVTGGRISIEGADLEILTVTDDEIQIGGRLRSVTNG